MQWLKGFLSAPNGDASSKRLLTIISYIVSLGIGIYCVLAVVALDANVLILLLGLCGATTTQQILGSAKETKE